jgi:hypothetical protein
MFVIKTFGSSNDSYSAVERQKRRDLSVCIALSRGSEYRVVKHFEEIGNMHYKSETECEHCASVLTKEIVGVAWEAIIKTQQSVLRSAQQMTSQSARHGKYVVMSCCLGTKCN